MTLNHGVVETSISMPVGACGAVKVMSPTELRNTDAQIILSSTFHLRLRLSLEVMGAYKDLYGFNGRDKPILTDSSDLQALSLSDLRKITEEDITFASPIDGDKPFLSPEISMQTQRRLNSDIVMQFDECTPYKTSDRPATETEAAASMYMNLRRAQRSHSELEHEHNPNALFDIVQDGTFENLCDESLAGLQAIDTDAGGESFGDYAVGGLSVEELKKDMTHVPQHVAPHLLVSKPHYLMDAGMPEDPTAGVASDVDMFDCVMPTHNTHSGWLFIRFSDIKVKNAIHRNNPCPLNETCGCYTRSNFSRAYLHHLQRVGETLGARLNTIHSLYYYLELMAEARAAIKSHGFAASQAYFVADRAHGTL